MTCDTLALHGSLYKGVQKGVHYRNTDGLICNCCDGLTASRPPSATWGKRLIHLKSLNAIIYCQKIKGMG